MKQRNIKLVNIQKLILFFYLCLFPFGQLLKVRLDVFDRVIWLGISDVLILTFIYFYSLHKKPYIDKYVKWFIYSCIFSLLLSLSRFSLIDVMSGSFYLLRFYSYYCFFAVVGNLVRTGELQRSLLYNSLILISVFVAIFGWIQYFVFPDLTSLKYLNWDDHLYRLVGTFLDPTFTGILLVFGAILSLISFAKDKSIKLFTVFLFLLISVAFTYSRSSFLAIGAAIIFLFLKYMKASKAFLGFVILFFAAIVVFLPRPGGEGTMLERTQSIFAKVGNYEEAYVVISQNPLFGVGFNNLCPVRMNLFGVNPVSHACSGLDSSILFIVATTGIMGSYYFTKLVVKIFASLDESGESLAFRVCAVALFVHSFFSQSAFYSFVMGFMAILYAVAIPRLRDDKQP